jgi:uncharacterized FAD-dependent dehydrogenase
MQHMRDMKILHDTIVIGAGPSGILAALRLLDLGVNFIIVDRGVNFDQRNYQKYEDIAGGFGGAGLFSDGKISYPPASTNLWLSTDKQKIKNAYYYLQRLMSQFGISLLEFDNKWQEELFFHFEKNKFYISDFITKNQAKYFLSYAYEKLFSRVKFNTEIVEILKKNNVYLLKTNQELFQTKNIIIATGKLALPQITESLKVNSEMCFEAGIRVETLNDFFKPYHTNVHDYKYIEKKDDTVFRTFCCCKNGEVVKSKIGDFYSYNGIGRISTKKSNIGLLIKTINPKLLPVFSTKIKNMKSQKISLYEFIKGEFFGEPFDNMFKIKIKEIIDLDCLDIVHKTDIYLPEIERFGKYYSINTVDFKVNNERIWICGDASNLFRGLLSAMISGIYVVENMIEQNKLFIKNSDSSNIDLVFTAHSKHYFYCKDVICQFVFNQNRVPINPFNVFGYFLNDRVDRDKVRRGNNQLIRACNELWVFGPISDGVLYEIKLAKAYQKRMRFFNISSEENGIYELQKTNLVFEPAIHAKGITKQDLINYTSDNQDNATVENILWSEKLENQLTLFDTLSEE